MTTTALFVCIEGLIVYTLKNMCALGGQKMMIFSNVSQILKNNLRFIAMTVLILHCKSFIDLKRQYIASRLCKVTQHFCCKKN